MIGLFVCRRVRRAREKDTCQPVEDNTVTMPMFGSKNKGESMVIISTDLCQLFYFLHLLTFPAQSYTFSISGLL